MDACPHKAKNKGSVINTEPLFYMLYLTTDHSITHFLFAAALVWF